MVRKVNHSRISLLLLKTFSFGVLSSLVIALLAGCTSLLYVGRVPAKKFYDPSVLGLKQEEIEFADKDGTRLHGWWFSSKTQPSKGTVVFFHGNGENLTTHFISLSWMPAEGYNYFIFDYPNYGVSEGDPSPYSTVMSGHAALEWVHDNKDDRPLIVYGHSLGGNVAHRTVLDMKDKLPIRALVLDGTFLSYRSIARKKASENALLWLLQPVAWLIMSDRYAPENIEKRAPIPLLVIHGQKDTMVPPQFGEDIFEKSAEPKEIWRIEEGEHGDTFWKHQKQYRQKFLDYLSQHP